VGQVAIQVGSWVGTLGPVGDRGLELQGVLGAEVPFADRLSAIAWLGAQRHRDGELDPRDAVVGVSWTAVSRDDLVVRLQPGLNLPTGGLGSGFYFTPLSTGSVDPYLTADATYGSAWLVGGAVVARTSLYPGFDRRLQGTFLRADLRGARRLGIAIPWVGLSAVRQLPSDPVGAVPDFSELALGAGAVVNVSDRWSVMGQLRGALWASDGAERQLAGGVSARTVIGKRRGDDEH
jgi:hypothetical protein